MQSTNDSALADRLDQPRSIEPKLSSPHLVRSTEVIQKWLRFGVFKNILRSQRWEEGKKEHGHRKLGKPLLHHSSHSDLSRSFGSMRFSNSFLPLSSNGSMMRSLMAPSPATDSQSVLCPRPTHWHVQIGGDWVCARELKYGCGIARGCGLKAKGEVAFSTWRDRQGQGHPA